MLAIFIGLGGFFGTIARYYSGQLIHRFELLNFPFATLFINLTGCFIIGLIYGWFEKNHIPASDWKMVLTAGFCGGFTTFSAFSIENIQLIRDGQYTPALVYIFLSVVVGLALTYGGILLMKNAA